MTHDKLARTALSLLLLSTLSTACNSPSVDPSNPGNPNPPTGATTTALSVDVTSASVVPSASQTFNVAGGTAPYTWSVTTGSGTITPVTSTSVRYSSATSQNAVVTVTDSASAVLHIPVRVSQTVTQVSHAGWVGCATLATGEAKCWGFDNDGRLDGISGTNRSSPVTRTGLSSGVAAIATANNAGCAIMMDASLKCFGFNYYGSVGNGVGDSANYAPTTVTSLSNVAQVAFGGYNVCARLSSGSVACWGYNNYGQIGDGTVAQRNAPYVIPGIGTAIWLAVGPSHACAVLADHTAKCWGRNALGELGDGTTTDQHAPVAVAGVSGIQQIAVGDFHSCALLTGGTVTCWGRGDSGQLGNGSLANVTVPTGAPVPGISGATLIAAAGGNSCAALPTALKCWGDAGSGAVGTGIPVVYATNFSTPQTVVNIGSGVTSLSIGPSNWGSTVAAVVNGQVYTWGLNDNLQLGNGTADASLSSPTLTAPF